MLELKHVSKHYNKTPILHNVSLSLNKGDIAILLGHSGVGKSTLLRILNNLEEPDKGEFILDGTPFDIKMVNQLHTIGHVFQHFNLFDHLSVKDNLLMPLTHCRQKDLKDSEKITDQLLSKYNLFEKKEMFPSQLSGGQKQRLAIARAVCLEPKVLCMDEPTSALDPLTTNQVAQHIKELADQGYIILIATHDTSLIEKLNCKVYLMEGGEIVESSTSEELKKKLKILKILDYLKGNR